MSAPRARILYIDDDPGLCRLVQKDLERQGYVIEIVTDGASGVASVASAMVIASGTNVKSNSFVLPASSLSTITCRIRMEWRPWRAFATSRNRRR